MAPHVIWTEFSPNRKASGVRHATGYPIEVLEHAWDKYGSALIRAVYRYPGFEVIARARDRRKLGSTWAGKPGPGRLVYAGYTRPI